MLLIRLLMLLLSALLVIGGLIYIYGSLETLYSFVIAYITSSIILLSSFKSYQSVVNKRLKAYSGNFEFDDRDLVDKIDDPYALYEDEDSSQNLDIKEVIKKEKEILKKSKRGLINSFKDSVIAFNPIRLIAYVIFILGFFYLINSHNLSILTYLLTLAIPNIIVVFYLLYFNKAV